jgi:hypothetical protein
MSYSIPDNYYNVLAGIESNHNPNAKASTSSASGLYQFVQHTWEGLGYNWSQVFNPQLQNQAISKLTNQNAVALSNAGIDVNNASLYAAHFFGAGTAEKVLGASDGTKVSSLVPNSVIKANGFLKNMTVGNFKDWLAKKTGNSVSSSNGLPGLPSLPSLNDITGGIGGAATSVGGVIADATKSVTDSVGVTGDGGFLSWIRELFSFHTAARFSAVIVGVILITIALAAFVLTSDSGKQVVKVASKAAA